MQYDADAFSPSGRFRDMDEGAVQDSVESYKVLGSNHVSLTISNLDRSISFFSECIGFDLKSRAGRDSTVVEKIVGVPGADIEVAYLAGHGLVLELIHYSAPSDRTTVVSRPCDSGFSHLAFDVKNLDAAVSAAAAWGFQPLSTPVSIGAPDMPRRRVCYMRDSDGVTVELIERLDDGSNG